MTSSRQPQHPALAPFRAVVLDIEGTTTPISFVYDALFPFAATHLVAFLTTHWDAPDVQDDVAQLAAQAAEDVAAGLEGAVPIPDVPPEARRAATIASCQWLMASDRKVTGLKSLQGKIWREGYASGALKGVVFDDVPPALARWAEAGVPVYIYSSGSVEAQRLLFAHAVGGDLTPHLAGHFDTTTGPKREPASYAAIARASGLPPAALLFLTDVVAEAEAARAAGLQAAIMARPGNHPQPTHDFPLLEDMDAL